MNDSRHLYLYAKGHYKETDMIDDLKKIVSKIAILYPEHVLEKDIKYWLLKEVYKYIKTEDDFTNFVNGDTFMPIYKDDIIAKSLSILRFKKITDIDMELGKTDPKILPLK